MIKKTYVGPASSAGRNNESAPGQVLMSDTAWQRWQASYGAVRRKIFEKVLKLGGKRYEEWKNQR